MKLALIGYGKMGKEIEKICLVRKHEILFKFDLNNKSDFIIENLKKCDVAIEFSQPDSAFSNYMTCFEAGVPVVTGTTGWLERLPEIKKMCAENKKTFFYASNFSIGVNLFFEMNKKLAQMMNSTSGYDIEMTEIHHTEKKDTPSGTAITLAEGIIENFKTKTSWSKEIAANNSEIAIKSLREHQVTGTHIIKYESDVDLIEIKHLAKNRVGFATGAIFAAEFVQNKIGFYGMSDLLNFAN